jgi:DNA polymerase II
MTTAGAEPLDNRKHPLDREHYVDKQVRPVAELVLETLDVDFEGDRRPAPGRSFLGGTRTATG